MKIPLISVIVPSFRSGKSISFLFDSILEQSFKNFEIIVADGGSDDDTLEIIEKYKSSFKNMIVNSEKDEGIYDAINKGVSLANGKWIYIIGTDDRIFDKDVFLHFSEMENKVNERLIYGNVQVVGDAGWARDGQIYDGSFDNSKLLIKNICQQAVFYHYLLFKKYGMFEKRYKVCSDWDFLLRVVSHEPIKYIDLTVARFYGGGTSVSRMDEAFQAEFIRNLYKYFGRRLKSSEFYSLRHKIHDLAGEFYRSGKRISAYKCNRIYKWLDEHPPNIRDSV